MIIVKQAYGFFSNFFKVLNSMIVADNTGHQVKVDMREKTSYNIWDKMFVQSEEHDSLQKHEFLNRYPGNNENGLKEYPFPLNLFNGYIFMNCSIYQNEHLQKIREIYHNYYKKLVWTDFLKKYINERTIPNFSKTIAVTIRIPRHYGQSTKNEYIYSIIDELKDLSKNYDKILLLTQIKKYKDLIIQEFGNKVIWMECNLVNEDDDWVDVSNLDYEKEFINSFSDVFIASQCDFIIGGSSNMMLGALIINPNIKFKLFECLKNFNGA
jgi:hypothetical protein